MNGNKCLKILALVTLIPLALRASSLLLGGHGSVPAASSSRHSWHVRRRPVAAAGLSVLAGSVHKAYQHTRRQRRRRAESTVETRRLRRVEVDGGDWLEDDKRLGPTGSNPLHNLRR